MFYIIKDNELNSWSDYKYDDDCLETNIITKDELDSHPNKVIVKNNMLILNPNYEQEEQEKELERVSNLKCTKRVLALMLKELGVGYSQLKELIATDENAQLEWDLCIELLRKNPLLDLMGEKLGITHEQLDNLFKYANGEITLEEFKGEPINE